MLGPFDDECSGACCPIVAPNPTYQLKVAKAEIARLRRELSSCRDEAQRIYDTLTTERGERQSLEEKKQ